MQEDERKVSIWRRLLKAALVLSLAFIVLLAALVLSLPYLVTRVPMPVLEFDLSPYLKGKSAELVKSKTATAEITISRGKGEGYRIRAKGQILDWNYTASMNVRLGFVRATGSLSASLDDTDWKLSADFGAESATDWHFNAAVKDRAFTQDDPVLATLLENLGTNSVPNLAFSGRFSLDAEGECTPKRPVPSWKASGSLRDVDASFDTAAGKHVTVKNLRLRFGAQGIADHTDISPLFPRAESITAAGIVLSNAFASVRATERSYLVTEAGADCCGGELKLYSLFLDTEKLNAGATIFAENIDAGEVLSRISGFRGEASGKLHGKLPFYLKDGRELILKDAYLFSKPGDTGKVRISDASPILDNLAAAGVPESDRANFAKALANLDYTTLKIELIRGIGGGVSALPLMLEGTATHGTTTVPVKLDVTFHGDFDQLINMGLNISRRRK